MTSDPNPQHRPPSGPSPPANPQYVGPPGQTWQPGPVPPDTTANFNQGPPAVQPGQPYAGPLAQPQQAYVVANVRRKDRSVALLLAIFLSFFTWLYTIDRDGWKFWLNLSIVIVNMVLSAITLGFWLIIAVPVGFGIWLWAIIDTAVKPRAFYDNYPAG